MGRKAVDVVLLPTETMMDRVIEVNRKLLEKSDKKIVLNRKNCLPHIFLAMGCVDERDIAVIEKFLRTITKECPLGDLRVIDIQTTESSAGGKVSVFKVEKTKELQLFHETVMGKLAPDISDDVCGDMIYTNAAVEGSTLLWIKNYWENQGSQIFHLI